ncbi:probable disease resistance protein At5g66910 [Quercus lobata]|uniref:probable disease resistance protein At5g66910 n=1 Tax=Quercus lobata TaxID=97700 RepID=UPI001247797C|nr:probable disease resistance protein At5g66910 [Quercus lobata]
MDLGSFPEDQRIPVAALSDMWTELHKLDKVGNDAICNLHKLTTWNLANHVRARKDASDIDNYYDEDYVTQHDLLRELAVYKSNQGTVGQRQRWIMEISGNTPPNWCTEQDQQLINARLLSISTDTSFLSTWCDIQAQKVECLVLNLRTKNYSLPEFVDKMDKFKKFSTTQLSTPFRNDQIGKGFNPFPLQGPGFWELYYPSFKALPNLMEINIDYCNDLVEFPAKLCDVILLKKHSINHCHQLSTLPEAIGKLVNLEVLRLRSCTNLSELPESNQKPPSIKNS